MRPGEGYPPGYPHAARRLPRLQHRPPKVQVCGHDRSHAQVRVLIHFFCFVLFLLCVVLFCFASTLFFFFLGTSLPPSLLFAYIPHISVRIDATAV